MPFDFGLLAIGLATTAASAAMSYAMQPEYPDAPSAAASSKAVKDAEARLLPARKQMEALARLGEKGVVNTGREKPIYGTRQVPVTDPDNGNRQLLNKVPDGNGGWKYEPVTREERYITGYEPETREIDFTGMGDADIDAKIADEMAQLQLDLSKEFSSDYIAEARKQLELADPEGTQARGKLYELMMADLENADKAQRPVADKLDTLTRGDLDRGGGLDAGSMAALEATLKSRGAGALGGVTAQDMEGSMTKGSAGENRRLSRLAQAMQYLNSGVSPTDVKYRREQQGMSNLGSFISGQTPTAQFSTLSGAQQGATPMKQGPALPQYNANAGAVGQQAAAANYGSQLNTMSQQMNPWYAGLGLAIQGTGAIGQMRKT